METLHSNRTVSVTELKRNYSAVLAQAGDDPVAVLNHNKAEAYLLSAAHYERLLERLEDLEDSRLAQKRADGPFVDVAIDEL